MSEAFTMPDYKKMYITLFKETTKVISILQAAQQKAEEIYISDDTENNLTLLKLMEMRGTKSSGRDKTKLTIVIYEVGSPLNIVFCRLLSLTTT